jgi:hypothetical protein
MVITQQVKYPMENQPADFVAGRMPFIPGISPRRFHGNNDITEESLELTPGHGRAFATWDPADGPTVTGNFRPGKGKHIGCAILAAERRVHPPHGGIVNEANVEVASSQAQMPLQALHVSLQNRPGQRITFLLIEDHGI